MIIDDYTSWVGCRQAVDDFRKREGIRAEMHPVYHEEGETVNGVWRRKE